MTKKLIIAVAIAIAVSLFAFYSINAESAGSNKGTGLKSSIAISDSGNNIELKPGMTLADPGKNAVFNIVSIDTIIIVGIRIDGGGAAMQCSSPLPGFQTFVNAVKLAPISTPSSPSTKKFKGKSLSTPIRVSDTWKSLKADAGITILSQNGDTLQLGIRIDGSANNVLLCSVSARALNAMLSESGKFQLVVAKTQENSSY